MNGKFQEGQVDAYVRTVLFETLETDANASDAVKIIETIICILDDVEVYFAVFCAEHGVENTEENLAAWRADLKAVFARQMRWLEETLGDLRRTSAHLFD